MRPLPFLLIPTVALVAQAPANVDLVQRFNTELPGVNQMLKELKTQEALTKVQGLIPAERPAFNGANLQTIVQSLDSTPGLLSLYKLWANVASEAGHWEKAVEVQEKRAQVARAVLADLEKAQAPIAAQWKKVAQDSSEYITKNEPRKKELEAKVNAFTVEREALNADIKAGKKKLTKKDVEEFNARAAQVQQDQQDLEQILATLPVHKQNLTNAPKVAKILADNRKEADGMVKAADEAVAKAKMVVSVQNDEITAFNTKQVMQKVKIVGRKNWVDAVLRNHDNVTKRTLNNETKPATPQEQVAFLNRLLVLDPGNAGTQKALDNLKAGKDAFVKEPGPAKKASPKKKK